MLTNFFSKLDSTVPIDLDLLAGSDLNEVEIDLLKAKREETEAKKKAQQELKRSNTIDADIARAAEYRAERAGESTTEASTIHKDMKCDVCQTTPIVGARYHCSKFVLNPILLTCLLIAFYQLGMRRFRHVSLVFREKEP
jgi:hypothetical protein